MLEAEMGPRPLCFVVMPFGKKPDPTGRGMIDFDRIYSQSLAPAIEDAGLEPIRADHERTGGVIHKPMFERLLLCDFAIADLTTANANVFYELGVRHTARPATTLTIFADHQPIPFDVNFLSSVAYDLGENNRFGDEQATALRTVVADKLVDLRSLAAKQSAVDSPLFQLLDEWRPSDIARLKADVFRDRVQLNETYKQQLGAIREKAKNEESRQDAMDELAEIRGGLPSFDAVDAGTTMDLMLTYRALEDWDGMIAVVEDMPQTLKRQVFVREQLGFAHNRRAGETKNPADRAEALRVLSEVEDQQGPSSETCGLIGRIHKDSWNAALEAGDPLGAAGHLKMAIAAYTRGFMADQRDAYPGINAITLLDIKGDEPSLRQKERLLPVVRFAVEQRLEGRQPDYWDHATMLELSVLGGDAESANESLADALAVIRETMEPRSTANNLRMIRRAREERGELQDWLGQVIEELEKRAG